MRAGEERAVPTLERVRRDRQRGEDDSVIE
jgi:hypothetical protein